MPTLLVLSVLLAAAPGLRAGHQEAAETVWPVPDEARAVENPVSPSEAALAAGEEHYARRCASCHGDTGKGDGKATRFIRPAPADISTAEARDRMTDGEMFYKITEGKKPMPGMARTLTDEERWQVVLYLRTLQPPR